MCILFLKGFLNQITFVILFYMPFYSYHSVLCIFCSASTEDVEYKSSYKCFADFTEWSRASPPCEHAVTAHQSDWYLYTTTSGMKWFWWYMDIFSSMFLVVDLIVVVF